MSNTSAAEVASVEFGILTELVKTNKDSLRLINDHTLSTHLTGKHCLLDIPNANVLNLLVDNLLLVHL